MSRRHLTCPDSAIPAGRKGKAVGDVVQGTEDAALIQTPQEEKTRHPYIPTGIGLYPNWQDEGSVS